MEWKWVFCAVLAEFLYIYVGVFLVFVESNIIQNISRAGLRRLLMIDEERLATITEYLNLALFCGRLLLSHSVMHILSSLVDMTPLSPPTTVEPWREAREVQEDRRTGYSSYSFLAFLLCLSCIVLHIVEIPHMNRHRRI